MRWVLIAALASGCAHARGADVANAVVTAALLAVEISLVENPAPAAGPLCQDPGDPIDPPHTCPGTGAGVTPPPPPPDEP